ncbi:VOC family protein [Roseivirga sp.]|uniref:VOC family protein n=1 Tax=Roseivirga sp. TaxID=1964215 RepID=UPI003B8ADC76
MLRTTINIFLFLISTSCLAQTSFDHMAIVVKNLEATKQFYTTALGFKNIEDPTGNPLIDWLENDNGGQLHLIEGDLSKITLTKSVHFSFAVTALSPFIQNLKDQKISFESWEGEKEGVTIRQDGVRQIYLQDPNGYWIEINDRQK